MKKIFLFLLMTCFSVVMAETLKEVVESKKAYTKENYPIKAHHEKLKFDCKTCHGDVPKEQYKNLNAKQCLSCHVSYKSLAKRTGHLGYDDNVHASPHYPDMDCNTCHSSHQKSVNYCVMCHSQESMKIIKVP